MSNTILIKEVNNHPVIFNVDNAADAARLEELQAVKMAEDLVVSVFGEQSNFADNTTCTITDNPDNAEFPYDVAFDASKIIETPKRYYEYLAKMAMPSNKYINLNLKFSDENNYHMSYYTSPANGYLEFIAQANSRHYALLVLSDGLLNVTSYASDNTPCGIFLPVKKNVICTIAFVYPITITSLKFIYAYGEI